MLKRVSLLHMNNTILETHWCALLCLIIVTGFFLFSFCFISFSFWCLLREGRSSNSVEYPFNLSPVDLLLYFYIVVIWFFPVNYSTWLRG